MENAAELIGILQAISVVARNLAKKLMRIERDVKEYESGMTDKTDGRKVKKGSL